MTPEILADTICQSVHDAFDKTGANRSVCIHIPETVETAVRKYCKDHPASAMQALARAKMGDKDHLNELVRDLFPDAVTKPCEDPLCLACRCERMMDRTEAGNPWSLEAMAAFLGMDVMRSVKWTNDILDGTINSKKSSDSHRQKAQLARGKMFPALLASAAMVHELHRDLEEAIEARDKYHKLADFLMDGESDPAS
jgi:hypothetical protein